MHFVTDTQTRDSFVCACAHEHLLSCLWWTYDLHLCKQLRDWLSLSSSYIILSSMETGVVWIPDTHQTETMKQQLPKLESGQPSELCWSSLVHAVLCLDAGDLVPALQELSHNKVSEEAIEEQAALTSPSYTIYGFPEAAYRTVLCGHENNTVWAVSDLTASVFLIFSPSLDSLHGATSLPQQIASKWLGMEIGPMTPLQDQVWADCLHT